LSGEARTERLAERGGLRLAEDAPPLLGPSGLEHARRIVLDYRPHDASQAAERERVLAFIDAHPDALERSCVDGHLTAAAFLFDGARERVLLTHHRKLDRWLQLGGHADGDGNLVRAALREGVEESGIEGLVIDPRPIDLDIHAIPARRKKDGTLEPEHLHLDVRFCVYAPVGAREVVSDESHELGWFGPDELEGLGLDDSVTRLFRLAFG
jgi:hypothetical protein